MKQVLIVCTSIIILLTAYTRIHRPDAHFNQEAYDKAMAKKRQSLINCVPDWSTYYLSPAEINEMGPLPGTGAHIWKISTRSDSAQFYFNQGINLYYGFHITEAMPSFKKAQLFDSSCAMLYWAEALAYGPNINDLGYFESPEAVAAVKHAELPAMRASTKEKELVAAMMVRYSADTGISREKLNQQYADKMKAVFADHPHDAEIGALYADALMVQHPWDLWLHNGKPQPWEAEIQKTLEAVLKYAPDHPGANHYYIHTLEAGPLAYKALPSANRLGSLAPGLAHQVHMPSHIYIRTGNYERGEAVNDAAVAAYHKYETIFPSVENSAALYEIHNLHMRAACSMNLADYATALKDAEACRNSFPPGLMGLDAPMGGFIQYVYMTPELTMVTFQKWNSILAEPAVNDSFHYALAIQEFAKGMAFAHSNKINEAKDALKKLEILLKEKDMAVVFPPFNAPLAAGTVAKDILAGTIGEAETGTGAGLAFFRRAVAEEDALVYNEPRDWLIPARHYLGYALLAAGIPKEAENVFTADLKVQPNNETAKKGLMASRKGERKG